MSSRKIRHNGQMLKASDIISRTKKYKYNKQGSLEEITTQNTLGDDEFKFGGSKSSLRRMADLERNVSLLINKVSTSDGEADDGNDDDFDNNINKDTRFKKDVQLGSASNDEIDIYGHLDIKNDLTLGTKAEEVIQDLVGAMFSGTETGMTATYNDSGSVVNLTVNSAPKLTTARTISLSGDASGSVTFDGSANKSLSVTVANDSHTHAFGNITGKPTTLSGYGITDSLATDAELTNGLAGKVSTNSAQSLTSSANALTFSANTLTLSRGDGTTDTVDLSAYMDDTNAARITSGTMASNGTATFTRDDATTFTVDMSVLLYDTNLTRITSAGFNTSNGVLTLTRNGGSTVTVDLDGRYTDNGYADTMNQHVRTTDSPSFVAVTAANFYGEATTAKYADLAERYAADAEYAEGTLMAFGGDAEVTAAAGYASGKLAGVISTKPAVMMNSDAGDDATHPYIALQGRVPVSVEGDVKKGDILVASDIAGLAAVWMNEDADPRMTAYVGIAISDSADGMVEVKVGK